MTTKKSEKPAQEVVEAAFTDTERAIAKFESRLVNVKHIDAKDLALNYLFPLLRKLAATSGDQEEQIESLIEAVEQIEAGSGDAEVFEAARNVILKLANLLDETMVASGFYTVQEGVGLKDTGKAPASIRASYAAIGPEVHEVVTAIQEAITAFGEGEDGDDDDDGDEGDDGEDDEGEVESDGDPSESAAAQIANAALGAAAAEIAPPANTSSITNANTTPNASAEKGAPDAA